MLTILQVKLGYLACQHALLTAKNIEASLNGQPLKPWKPNGGMQVFCQPTALPGAAMWASLLQPSRFCFLIKILLADSGLAA